VSSPARACAYRVVRRVFEQGAYADRALHAEADGLDPRERALATALAYGVVQRRATLDHVVAQLSNRPPERLDPGVRAALWLGLEQLLFLGGVADHAAVNESVELAKRSSRGGAGLVNAVLRRAVREGPGIIAALEDSTPAGAALMYSLPQWLAELWWRELGPEQARALMRSLNKKGEVSVRVNRLVSDPSDVTARLPVPARAAPELPEGLVLDGPFDAHASELFEQGAIMPQSRASMLVARTLAPAAGERILDLCAAPGGKTTHLAALIGDEGEIVAVERHPGRARALARTCERLRARSVRVELGDAGEFDGASGFDRVLVDPPCSGLGTLQSRPDRRWRASLESIGELAALQRRILAAGASALKPGGTLVYSVCTISRAESEDVVAWLLAQRPELELVGEPRQLLPHRDGTDGFYIARLRRG
jgi:16S rRNA (cytosine967-C5)-methyltransferase